LQAAYDFFNGQSEKQVIEGFREPDARAHLNRNTGTAALDRLDSIAATSKNSSRATEARIIAGLIRSEVEEFRPAPPPQNEPSIIPTEELLANVQRITDELATEGLSDERRADLEAQLEQAGKYASIMEDKSAEGSIKDFAALHGLEESTAAKIMPTNYYKTHPEARQNYKMNITPEELEDIEDITDAIQNNRIYSIGHAPGITLNYVKSARDKTPYMKTPFGPLRLYDPADPKANHDPKYKLQLLAMEADIQQGNMEGAEQIYERLHMKDRGILHKQPFRIAKYGKALVETNNEMRKLLSATGVKNKETFEELFKRVRDTYLKMPPKFRNIQIPNVKRPISFEDYYKGIEALHRAMKQAKEWDITRFARGIGTELFGDPDLYEGQYLYEPKVPTGGLFRTGRRVAGLAKDIGHAALSYGVFGEPFSTWYRGTPAEVLKDFGKRGLLWGGTKLIPPITRRIAESLGYRKRRRLVDA
jgi:hypothetical protein